MSRKTDYNQLMQDLQSYANKIEATELEQLVQQALVAMALELRDDEALPAQPIACDQQRPINLNDMICKIV